MSRRRVRSIEPGAPRDGSFAFFAGRGVRGRGPMRFGDEAAEFGFGVPSLGFIAAAIAKELAIHGPARSRRVAL